MIDALPLLLGPEGYQISRSVRLRSSASAYFSRTLTTPTDAKKWTWSGWVKRGILGASPNLFWAWSGSGNEDQLMFSTDTLRFYVNGGTTGNIITSAVFRDPSAWYHIIAVYDSANATSNDRMILYVNGVRQTLSTNTQPTLNYSNQFNTAVSHSLGRNVPAATYFDGYLTEVNFIDGQALTPSSFGETNAVTGVWQPKKYAGTYGTNGFYLNFSDNSAATAAAIGKDNSGNGNNWTPNNISVTAGVTYDSMLDVPTQWADGGNGRGNYCVWNPLDKGTVTVSNGNLSAVAAADTHAVRATMELPQSGKWYWETTVNGLGYGSALGIASPTSVVTTGPSSAATRTYQWGSWFNSFNGGIVQYGTNQGITGGANWSGASQLAASDVLMIAVDMSNGSMWVGKNGTWFNSSGTANPATNTDPRWTGLIGTAWFAYYSSYGSTSPPTADINFGQRPFAYTPPSGFKALNTLNLPTPTILKGNQYFDVNTWTGNGTSQNIVNSGAMQPDLVWAKQRSSTQWHRLIDAVRGSNKVLYSNDTSAEFTDSTQLTSFNSNGFSIGSEAGWNANAATYVGWQWKEGATQGFDIVTGTSTGTTGTLTLAHSLGVAPAMVIAKNRNVADDWYTWHTSLGASSAGNAIRLNTTAAKFTSTGIWGTGFTSSNLLFGQTNWFTASGQGIVAYAFSEVAGFSKFGSYTGNGSADGPFVFCGFRPRFVMIKRTDSTSAWLMVDTVRQTYNVLGPYLTANTSDAETTGSVVLDVLSNGFKMRSATTLNASGGTYIFAAFSESPFKNALAR